MDEWKAKLIINILFSEGDKVSVLSIFWWKCQVMGMSIDTKAIVGKEWTLPHHFLSFSAQLPLKEQ